MNDEHGGHIPRTGKLWKDRPTMTDLEMAEVLAHVRENLRAMLSDPKNPPAPKS